MNAIRNSSHVEYTCDCLNLCCKERNVIHSMPRLTLYDHDVSLNVECNCRCGHLTLFMVMWMFRFEPNENRDVTQHCISLWFSSKYGVQLNDLVKLQYKEVTASTFAGEEHCVTKIRNSLSHCNFLPVNVVGQKFNTNVMWSNVTRNSSLRFCR